jgi:predicted enzyme related to lactoylglutathione lyase
MIRGAHVIVYSRDPEADRAFIRDVLEWPHVDAHGGWLIFAQPPAELAFHPLDPDGHERHELYLMCDDIQGTMEQLASRGAEFVAPVTEARFGLLTQIRLPGGSLLGLYEPRHASPLPAFS